MIDSLKKILSHDSGPFWQFVKYGAIGVMATLVQTGVFYLFATTCLMNRWFVWFGLMTTFAVFVEVVVSFLVNFSVRKFFIFKG